ncbi:MAG: tetratricopeptide repeat protein, partial [Rhodothermales bacterium]
ALTIFEQVLGPDHPNTVKSLNNLAGLLDSQGKYDEAEPLYRRALGIFENALGPDHPNTITARKNFQIFLREQGRDDEAAALETGA